MSALTHTRGHVIFYDGKDWRYKDNGNRLQDELIRPCIRCGHYPSIEGYDACLDFIEGVSSACCGHGVIKPYFLSEN